ncbi:MAG TPA: hypothetical protein VIW24_13815 [Aldersonia sp.]
MRIRTRTRVLVRLTAFLAVAAAAAIALAAPATATPTTAVDWRDAAVQLRAAAAGNPDAEAALDRLLASPLQEQRHDVLLPAQVFQIPAYSDTGRMDGVTGQLYGSGIALGIDGFRFGFFGGPGRFAPNQAGARLDVMWLNLSTGQSGSAILNQTTEALVDTTIRTGVLNPGNGTVVAAIYGSTWHRWPVPENAEHPDGFAYVKSTIWWPSLGAVIVN